MLQCKYEMHTFIVESKLKCFPYTKAVARAALTLVQLIDLPITVLILKLPMTKIKK